MADSHTGSTSSSVTPRNEIADAITRVEHLIAIARERHRCRYSLAEAARAFVSSVDERTYVPVLPLVPFEKRPRYKGGVYAATTEPSLIAMHWPRHTPRWGNYNIGVVPEGRFVVLDIDQSLREVDPLIASAVCSLIFNTSTPVHVTPSGNLHVFTRAPMGVGLRTRIRVSAGVDFLGDRRLVVVPPSEVFAKQTGEVAPYVPLRTPYVHARDLPRSLQFDLAPYPDELIPMLEAWVPPADELARSGGTKGSRPRGQRLQRGDRAAMNSWSKGSIGALSDEQERQIQNGVTHSDDLDAAIECVLAARFVAGSVEGCRNDRLFHALGRVFALQQVCRITSDVALQVEALAASRGLDGDEIERVERSAWKAAVRHPRPYVDDGVTLEQMGELLRSAAAGRLFRCHDTFEYIVVAGERSQQSEHRIVSRRGAQVLTPSEMAWIRKKTEVDSEMAPEEPWLYAARRRLNFRGAEALRIVDARSCSPDIDCLVASEASQALDRDLRPRG